MKKFLLPLLLMFALVGCNSTQPQNHNIDDDPTDIPGDEPGDDDPGDDDPGDDDPGDDDPGHNDPPPTLEYEVLKISEAKERAQALTQENSVGIAISEDKVEIVGRLLAVYTTTAQKSDYSQDYAYRVLLGDETGYMYVSIPDAKYKNIKDYAMKEDSYYKVQGVLTKYLGVPAIKSVNFDWQKGHEDICTVSVIKSFVSETSTVKEVVDYSSSLRINIKGINYGKMMKVKAKYLEKMDDSVLLFGDGVNTFRVHGSNKVGNNFTLGNTYVLYGTSGMYIYQHSFEFIALDSIDEDINIDLTNVPYITATDLYKVKYTNDKAQHYTDYENSCGTLRRFKGYVSYYTVSSTGIHMVLTDTYKSKPFSSYTEATNGKALVLKNTTETGIYSDSDFTRSRLYPYSNVEIQIDIYFCIYELNTQHYWQIFALTSSLDALVEK